PGVTAAAAPSAAVERLLRDLGRGGGRGVADDTAAAVEALVPVARVQALDADLATARGGMQKAVATEVDTHVRVGAPAGVEEHQIAGLELRALEALADFGQLLRGARQIEPERALKDQLHQGAAVDAGVAGGAAKAV